ncbi:MAG: T9SS type A sorting domain-containing protein [Bacteroidota bacterium]|nr:T9SS type A sorting domain-containing protein [Bacteroidota bacterium]MDP4243533.1 T9SS type A sorting domain-containing protein [Bacteroidota bacterium]
MGKIDLRILFDSVPKHISKLQLQAHTWLYYGSTGTEDWNWIVDLRDLYFDSANIYLRDSFLTQHVDYLYYEDFYSDNLPHQDWSETLRLASSVDLSGIIHSTHLSNSAAVAIPIGRHGISFAFENGILQCVIDPSDRPRRCELFSVLGARLCLTTTAPHQHSIPIPHLNAGLYFLRLDEQVTKFCIAE